MEGDRLLRLALFAYRASQNIVIPDASWNSARIESVNEAGIAGLDPEAEGYTFMNLGKVLDWAGKFEEADNLFKRALDILGPYTIIYDRLARSSYGLGQYDAAMHYLHEIQRIAPEMPGVHSRMAMIFEKRGEADKAIEHCRAELELNYSDHHVHAALANLLVKKGDDTAALSHYNNALQLEPDNQYSRVELARLLLRLHRYDEALVHAQEALRINPKQYRVHNALGLIMKHQGRHEEAARYFTEALRLKPGDKFAREHLRQVQAVRARKGSRDDLS